jgi:hypothetical protein
MVEELSLRVNPISLETIALGTAYEKIVGR